MTPVGKVKLRELIAKHEGCRLCQYRDTTGHATIGYGHKINGWWKRVYYQTITKEEAVQMLNDDITYFLTQLQKLDWFNALDENRQIAICDMCFNLGVKGLLQFKGMIAGIEAKNYSEAAYAMMNSLAAQQDHARYKELASIMQTGTITL